jgi:hypothetical protein
VPWCIEHLLGIAMMAVACHNLGFRRQLPACMAPSVFQAFVGVNWVMADEPLDVETQLAIGFLDYLMMVGVGGLLDGGCASDPCACYPLGPQGQVP